MVNKRSLATSFRLFGYVILFLLSLFGFGRLYFYLTDGFSLANISSDFLPQPDLDVRVLNQKEQKELEQALDQPYRYLGKGCQSYAFLSADNNYVIKFFKYQNFRLRPWLNYLPDFFSFSDYKEKKQAIKSKELATLMKSWKLAFEQLKEETQLVYIHLNKTKDLSKRLVIEDNLGLSYVLNLDEMEFCVQRRAELLCDVLMKHQKVNDQIACKQLIDHLLELILSEYSRGLADTDHALMRNTGVVNEQLIHIDIGKFSRIGDIEHPFKYHQELFTKTYKFRKWLEVHSPLTASYMEMRLKEIMSQEGEEFNKMQPIWWYRLNSKDVIKESLLSNSP